MNPCPRCKYFSVCHSMPAQHFLAVLVRRTYEMPDSERCTEKCLETIRSASATEIMRLIRLTKGEKPSVLRTQAV